MRLYLDANIIIYLIEAVEPFQSRIRNRLFSFESQSASELVTSRLSCLECRSKPLAEKNSHLLEHYDQFFSRSLLQLVEITPDVIERATAIRAQYGFKSADAMRYISPAASYARLIYFSPVTPGSPVARNYEPKLFESHGDIAFQPI